MYAKFFQNRNIFIICLLCVFGVVYFYTVIFSENEVKNKILSTDKSEMLHNKNITLPNNTKYILYWDKLYNQDDMGFGFGSEIFKNCEQSNCFTTKSRTYKYVEDFDAIIFFGARYSVKKYGIPKKRKLHQKYIFFNIESAFNTYFEKKVNVNFYNWTMTFRRDSDIYYPYGIFVKNETNYVLPSVNDIRKRSRKVAWFVSNCHSSGTSRRQKYAAELKKYIPVDIYGKCGDLNCTGIELCYKMLEENYKFYLAFENSMCEDYITEKLFNVMNYNIVPIGLSFADYKAIVPERSMINTNDFINPKHLATYLWKLDSDDEEYLKYFEWKTQYVVEDPKQKVLCDLCKKLHEPLTYSSYENIEDWFFGFGCVS